MNFVLVILIVTACSISDAQVWRPRFLGSFTVNYAAFIGLIPTENNNVDPLDKFTFYVSTFDSSNSFPDKIFYMRSPGRYLDDVQNWNLTLIDETNYWPNDMVQMPSSVVGTEGILWTSGFLHKPEGHLSLYLTNTDPLVGPYNIASLDVTGNAYHDVAWHDVNHDGFLDAIAGRFIPQSDILKEFLWLENPGLGTPSEGWTQHMIIENGPDVSFLLSDISVGNQSFVVIISPEYWNARLTIHYAADGSDVFLSDPTQLLTVVVDSNAGQSFGVDFIDLNLDGKKEILVSAWDGVMGKVYAYVVPDDFRTEPFPRITIADEFFPSVNGSGYMSPGECTTLYRGVDHENSGLKPYVMLSGDDDGHFYILTPDSENKNDFNYTKNELMDTGAKIAGDFAVADVDNDGYNELMAAGYTAGTVYVFTFSP